MSGKRGKGVGPIIVLQKNIYKVVQAIHKYSSKDAVLTPVVIAGKERNLYGARALHNLIKCCVYAGLGRIEKKTVEEKQKKVYLITLANKLPETPPVINIQYLIELLSHVIYVELGGSHGKLESTAIVDMLCKGRVLANNDKSVEAWIKSYQVLLRNTSQLLTTQLGVKAIGPGSRNDINGEAVNINTINSLGDEDTNDLGELDKILGKEEVSNPLFKGTPMPSEKSVAKDPREIEEKNKRKAILGFFKKHGASVSVKSYLQNKTYFNVLYHEAQNAEANKKPFTILYNHDQGKWLIHIINADNLYHRGTITMEPPTKHKNSLQPVRSAPSYSHPPRISQATIPPVQHKVPMNTYVPAQGAPSINIRETPRDIEVTGVNMSESSISENVFGNDSIYEEES